MLGAGCACRGMIHGSAAKRGGAERAIAAPSQMDDVESERDPVCDAHAGVVGWLGWGSSARER